MWLLILIVIFSPVLAFKGLTLETLWNFFNFHPFWFVILIMNIIRSPFREAFEEMQEFIKKKGL